MLTVDLTVNIRYDVTMVKKFLSTAEVARLLGISRVAVFKKIKAKEIRAQKVGRNFVIQQKDLPEILGTVLSESKKKQITSAVKRVTKEYSETLRLLGKE